MEQQCVNPASSNSSPVKFKMNGNLTQSDDEQEKFLMQNEVKQNGQFRIIKLGVCAMKKKVSSYSMTQILERIRFFSKNEIEVYIFPQDMILNSKVTEWPKVDVLYAFFSNGFPLEKAQEYQKLVKPFVLNDVYKQEWLWDRKKIYQELVNINVPVPTHYFVMRNSCENINKKYKQSPMASMIQLNQKSEVQMESIAQQIDNQQNNLEIIDNSDSDKQIDLEKLKPIELLQQQNNSNKTKKCSYASLKKTRTRTATLSQFSQNNQHLNKIESNQLQKSNLQQINDIDDSNSPFTSDSPSSQLISSFQQQQTEKDEVTVNDLEEYDDYILVDGKKLFKPFVEKPFDAEDHNIYIYYHSNDGGGCKKLFRKVGNQSSVFDKNISEIRQDGNYIYEEFQPTGGFDIKVYTVGADYAHAEARKSPVLDGKVQRTSDGKEIRYPVVLTAEEKRIASRIVFWFGQRICGFDLLRSKGKSYVCDINGMSFVKGNENYFQDCAVLLRKIILKELFPDRLAETALHQLQLLKKAQMPNLSEQELNGIGINNDVHYQAHTRKGEQLKSIVAVFRHGDRTPKQKMKQMTSDPRFLSFFLEQKDPRKEIKLKSAKSLQRILQIASDLVEEIHGKLSLLSADKTPTVYDSHYNEHNQIQTQTQQCVFSDYQEFKEEGKQVELQALDDCLLQKHQLSNLQDDLQKFQQLKSVLFMGGHFDGINRKIQLKPMQFQDDGSQVIRVTQALLVIKWGGELTHAGEQQAQQLGSQFREFYPECIMRLHSTYKHDLKIYSSDEGRCQMTAAAFCKGYLGLTGPLTPILVSLVRKDEKVQKWLDIQHGFDHSIMNQEQTIIDELLHSPGSLYDSFAQRLGVGFMSDHSISVLKQIQDPLQLMKKLHENITELTQKLQHKLNMQKHSYSSYYYITPSDLKPYHRSVTTIDDLNDLDVLFVCGHETFVLVYKRWLKLQQDFYNKKKQKYEISKIPSIYDSICYDITHNSNQFEAWKSIVTQIYENCKKLHQFVNYYQYGIKPQKKLQIGFNIARPLLKKLHHDVQWWCGVKNKKKQRKSVSISMDNSIENNQYAVQKQLEELEKVSQQRTRVYFTSASHLHSLFSVIRHGLEDLLTPESLEALRHIKYLGYLSCVVFKVYENNEASEDNINRFRLEISISPGSIMQYQQFPLPFNSDQQQMTLKDNFVRKTSLNYKTNVLKENNVQQQFECQKNCVNHMVSVEKEIILNQNLTLEKLEQSMSKLCSIFQDASCNADQDQESHSKFNETKSFQNHYFQSDFLNFE